MAILSPPPVLQVFENPLIGPSVKVRESQMPEIERRLESSGLIYWFDTRSISYDGAPAVIYLNFSRKVDPAQVRELLGLDQ